MRWTFLRHCLLIAAIVSVVCVGGADLLAQRDVICATRCRGVLLSEFDIAIDRCRKFKFYDCVTCMSGQCVDYPTTEPPYCEADEAMVQKAGFSSECQLLCPLYPGKYAEAKDYTGPDPKDDFGKVFRCIDKVQ